MPKAATPRGAIQKSMCVLRVTGWIREPTADYNSSARIAPGALDFRTREIEAVARASSFEARSAQAIGRETLQSAWTRRLGAALARDAFGVIVAVGLSSAASLSAAPSNPAPATPAPAPDAIPATLTIASEGARPPYNYFSGETLAGFEIDLGRDLCRRMAVTCTFVPQNWDDMIPGLLAHRYDAIMAAMEINDQRARQIAFSTPYVRMPSAFLVRKTTDIAAATPEAMAGRRIGVEQGGTHEIFLAKVYPDARIKRYGSLADAILDLEAGRVDAAIGDKDAIVAFLKTRRDAVCCRILADVPRYKAYFGDGIGIGLRKEDVALKAAFDKALAESKADGAFAKISARYFDFPID